MIPPNHADRLVTQSNLSRLVRHTWLPPQSRVPVPEEPHDLYAAALWAAQSRRPANPLFALSCARRQSPGQFTATQRFRPAPHLGLSRPRPPLVEIYLVLWSIELNSRALASFLTVRGARPPPTTRLKGLIGFSLKSFCFLLLLLVFFPCQSPWLSYPSSGGPLDSTDSQHMRPWLSIRDDSNEDPALNWDVVILLDRY